MLNSVMNFIDALMNLEFFDKKGDKLISTIHFFLLKQGDKLTGQFRKKLTCNSEMIFLPNKVISRNRTIQQWAFCPNKLTKT